LGIYFLLGSPDSLASAHAAAAPQPSHDTQMSQQPSPAAGSLDDVTNKLAARLAAQGGSDNDWQLLAESYEYMGRAAEAKAARAHVASGAPLAAASGDSTTGPASGDQIADIADAFDKPHVMTVASPATGSTDAAGGQPGMGTANATKGGPHAGSNAANTPTSSATAGTGSAEISGTVEITSKLARQAQSGATLFIYAKQPNAPGPPLAVLRVRAEHWPVSFTLNDGNAMVPGRNLSNANNVQIEARISKNGDALPQSGDLVGSVTSVNPRDGHPVKISIDREIG
jgi:cytochrome c-type biogenesis protein CcmH